MELGIMSPEFPHYFCSIASTIEVCYKNTMGKIPILQENEQAALRALKEQLSRKFNLVDFRLFGSKARGEGTSESDVDVMIEIEGCDYEIKSQIYDMVFDINLENDTFISTTIFSKQEIEEGPMSESPIYKAIQREGVPV